MRSNCDDAKCRAFCEYYAAQSGARQHGGALPVFIGSQHQYGAGLGDILRGIFRRVAPVVGPILKSTLGTFFGEAGSSLNQGKTFKESFTDALKPSLQTAITSTMENVKKAQSGGRKRKRTLTQRVYKRSKTSAPKLHRKKPKNRKLKFKNF